MSENGTVYFSPVVALNNMVRFKWAITESATLLESWRRTVHQESQGTPKPWSELWERLEITTELVVAGLRELEAEVWASVATVTPEFTDYASAYRYWQPQSLEEVSNGQA